MSYQLGKIVKTETGEERVDEVKIDPFIVWTLEEDILAKKEDEEAALDPKKKGAAGKAPAKK
jgi:hypothetical protein